MVLYPLQWLVWKLYIWLFVPKHVWYSCQHGKTILVVPARVMEEIYRDINNNPKAYLGSNMRWAWTHLRGGDKRYYQYELIFSDDPLYRTTEDRRTGGVVGSLAEFEIFRHKFLVTSRELYVPDAHHLPHDGESLGKFSDTGAIINVLAVAEKIFSHGRQVSTW